MVTNAAPRLKKAKRKGKNSANASAYPETTVLALPDGGRRRIHTLIAVSPGRRQADYASTVLARALSWADDRGLVAANPCAKGGRRYRGSRADKVWTADDEANFLAKAPTHLHLPLMLAIWTGQRQGDLLRLA
jgi:integrase